jgi:hypothetical protein
MMLGSILDVRQYIEEDGESGVWDHDFLMSKVTKSRYADTKQMAKDLWKWLIDNLKLELSGLSDHLEDNHLQTISLTYLVRQCKALISHKLESERAGIEGEAACVTAKAIRAAIERDFAENLDFMGLWPASLPDQTMESWVGAFENEELDYNWPAAPNGATYCVVFAV